MGAATAIAIGAVVGAASSYMSSKAQKKAAKEAAKPKYSETTKVPYGNEYISRISPYILASQQKVFENRMKGYGTEAPDFGPIGEMLAGIDKNYTGVGMANSPHTALVDKPTNPYNVNPMFNHYRPNMPDAPPYDEEGNRFSLPRVKREQDSETGEDISGLLSGEDIYT